MITGLWTLFASPVTGEPLTVFAAASLREALDGAVAASEAAAQGEFSGDVVISYGGSGAMARQVALGAPADVVILANEAWMSWLAEEGAVEADSVARIMGNGLVLVGPQGAEPLDALDATALTERLGDGRLAVGQVLSVPAGIYAKEWMQSAGLWEQLQPHLAETENVRAALALVERGEVPLGVVYATDARAAKVTVLQEIDARHHSPIGYWAAVTATRDHPQAAPFLAYLKGAAQAGFAELGFLSGPAP